jgi:hypothetical protein
MAAAGLRYNEAFPEDHGQEPDVTGLIVSWGDGKVAGGRLTDVAIAELHWLARGGLWRERSDQWLPPTALVHGRYLKLADHWRVRWQRASLFRKLCGEAR